MRRRRQKNPLLFKMIGVGLVVTVPLLFVLAQFGVFKSIQQHYLETTLVNLPPPPPEPKEPKPKAKKEAKAHPHVEAHHQQNVARATQKASPLPVHVAAATGSPASASDNAIVNGAGGPPPGQLPVGPPPPPVTPPALPTPVVTPPTPSPAVAPPAPAAPAPSKAPDIVAAQIVADPKPVLPDEFLDSDLSATFRAVFTIHADGTTDVKMVDSTGNEQLDQLALDAARQWKFRPALQNGQPVDSYQRLVVEFQVS